MKTAVKSPESAVYRSGLGIFLPDTPQHFFRPLFHCNPLSPALRSDPLALSGASRTKQIPSNLAMQIPSNKIIAGLEELFAKLK